MSGKAGKRGRTASLSNRRARFRSTARKLKRREIMMAARRCWSAAGNARMTSIRPTALAPASRTTLNCACVRRRVARVKGRSEPLAEHCVIGTPTSLCQPFPAFPPAIGEDFAPAFGGHALEKAVSALPPPVGWLIRPLHGCLLRPPAGTPRYPVSMIRCLTRKRTCTIDAQRRETSAPPVLTCPPCRPRMSPAAAPTPV